MTDNTQPRKAEDKDATKTTGNPGHEEDTFAADSNKFGQGRTTIDSMEKPGWKDPK